MKDESTANGETLLIVDDHPMNRDMLVRRLERHDYVTLCAEDGETCLKMLGEHDVQLVLLDIEMPGMDGLEVLRRIRETHSHSQLPVILVTARNTREDVIHGLEAGANDYVVKPIDFPVALARIRTHLLVERTERALRQSEERYALAARGANDGLWDWDLQRDSVYYSPRWQAIFGLSGRPTSDRLEHWLERVHPQDRDGLERAIEDHRRGNSTHFEYEHRALHANGDYRWVVSRGLAVGEEGRPTRFAGSLTDVTDSKVLDPLTGLPNKLLLQDRLEHCIKRVRREGGVIAVLKFDLDRFRGINDSLGHAAGDRLLRAFAERLGEAVRDTDTVCRADGDHTVARLGGDEFTVLLEQVADLADAERITARMLDRLAAPFVVDGDELYVRASAGIVVRLPDGPGAETLLRDADTALTRAKERGGGTHEVFDSEMRIRAVERLRLETDLRRALERDEFVLQYQPIVSLRNGTLYGFESLLRWNHPERGMVGPGDFIPLAEETGLMVPIGRWVWRTICRQRAVWSERWPGVPVVVSTNLSPSQFERPDLAAFIERTLRESGVDPRTLKLEITENVLLENAETAAAVLAKAREAGMRIAIDDFGTGYSSLAYLQALAVDTLKIDRSFVSKLATDRGSHQIVRAVIDLAHNLGMDVIAEGVETAEQAAELEHLTAEYAQGFLFARPLARDAAESLIEERLEAERGSDRAGSLGG